MVLTLIWLSCSTKELTVFGGHNSFYGCAEYADVILLKHTTSIELYTAVKCCLSTEGEKDAVRTLFFDDTLHEVGLHGEKINLVGHAFGGLYGGDVGVDEHSLYAFFAQGLEGLGA